MSGVGVAEVESRLAELRSEAGAGSHGMRTNVLDLVVFCDDEGTASEMVELIAALPFNRPSRALVALAATGEDVGFDARVVCAAQAGVGRTFCCEIVSLRAPDVAALPSLVSSLLLPDLPVFLLWRAAADRPDAFDAFWPVAQRVVLDSTLEPGTLRHVPALLAREPARAITDLSWTKITGWRECVTRLFDAPENAAALGRLDGLTVRHAGGSDAQALLLAGWVLARTGTRPEVLIAGEERPDMRSGSLTGVELHCGEERYVVSRIAEGVARLDAPRVPRQDVRLRVPHIAALVGLELEVFGRDRGFEAAIAALPAA